MRLFLLKALWQLGRPLTVYLMGVLLSAGVSMAQQLEQDPVLAAPKAPIAKAAPQAKAAPSLSSSSGRTVLSGVVSLETAMVQEKDVDWYGWYKSARKYLAEAGGFTCTPGTSILFYKSGTIQALSQDTSCLLSIARLRYPLPEKTQLQVVSLPSRSSLSPPASPEELKHLIEQNKRLERRI